MASLNSPLSELKRIGEKTGATLKKLGLNSVDDLLFYFPFRYESFESKQKISDLKIGDNANVVGTIELIQGRKSFKRRMFIVEAIIGDESGSLKVLWFNQPFLTKNFGVGDRISLAGKITESYGQLSMSSPDYEKINNVSGAELQEKYQLINTNGLVPVYHLTSGPVSQKQLRGFIKNVISLASEIKEWLPEKILRDLHLIPLSEAIAKIHFPKNETEILAAQRRLAFSELFLRQLKSQTIKNDLNSRQATTIIFQEKATQKFVASLPFKLTAAQKKTAWEILRDLEKATPMSRLLEGDVGSGKTLVAALAILNVALNNKQSALMVPSEILARQHFQTMTKLFKDYPFKIALKTHSYREGNFKEADIIIGTQALIQEKSGLENLALAIVDEQHRFGVGQRQKIINLNRQNSLTAHFLSLTATPIPRSLSLAIYGDLKLSLIDEMPAGRQKTITKIVKEENREKAYDFVRKHVKTGRQAFFVYPLIDESDKLAFKSVKKEYDKIAGEIFPEFKVTFIHGQLKKEAKEKIMTEFSEGKIDILLATSVIEVGIDIPNATLMIIEGADRFGLAQLHQFRGRINRSDKQSFCFLFLSQEEIKNQKTLERLEALTKYNDGLTLAKVDLKLRGAGEIFGRAQSGFSEMALCSLFDYELIKKAQAEAAHILENDPKLKTYPLLLEKFAYFESDFHLE
jgi:ATP-dependent DNA helicase RecG